MHKLWIIAALFSGTLSIGSAAQETISGLETPNAVTVSPGQFQELVPDQIFTFQLLFDRAPDHYGGGQIICVLQNEPEYAPNLSDIKSFPVYADLIDGQRIYSFSATIRDEMAPGIWVLKEVTLGHAVQKKIPIPEDARLFEISEPPSIGIHIQAPPSVRAGQQYTIKINTVVPHDLIQNCSIGLIGHLTQVLPDGQYSQSPSIVPTYGVEIESGKILYEMSALIAPDLPSGPWRGVINVASQPRIPPNNKINGMPQVDHHIWWMCHHAQLGEGFGFTFNIEPALSLVTPSSVAVTVNPSQIQLLLEEADHLKAKAQHLKQQLSSENMATNQILLRNSVQAALSDLDRTEATYKKLGAEPPSAMGLNVFFDDIRYEYGDALKKFTNNSSRTLHSRSRLEHVNAVLIGSFARLDRTSDAVIRSILHNAKAYDVLATSGNLTFTLEVSSTPDHATVSYRQRLDPEFKMLDHKTDWNIPNLYHATYLIKFQKPGCEDLPLITFDGAESNNTSVHADLVCKGRVR